MLHIAGGSYVESCIDPQYHEFYGSGLRAAVLVSGLVPGIRFSTYISETQLPNLEAMAATFGIEYFYLPCPKTIEFLYRHPLATPRVIPDPRDLPQMKGLKVDEEKILRFGLIEGDCVVRGSKVVYDPQSPANPRPFGENGSTASHLAIVANAVEARKLTGLSDVREMGSQLIASQGAEVIVIKQGALGCTVFWNGQQKQIPIFATRSVWPIGSGDVFSGAFAYFGAELGLDPFTAAEKSSLAAASYCSARSLPLRPDFEASPVGKPLVAGDKKLTSVTIYLAAPFFTMGDRYMVEETKQALEAQGFKVFSPYHDVGRGPSADVVPADIAGIEKSEFASAVYTTVWIARAK
jgi:pfkB family carbohydrate kinase